MGAGSSAVKKLEYVERQRSSAVTPLDCSEIDCVQLPRG